MESALRAQQSEFGYESGDSVHYSNPKAFALSAGKYQALCSEATMIGSTRAGNTSTQKVQCFVAGTPLQASFMSPKDVDGDAARILGSLE